VEFRTHTKKRPRSNWKFEGEHRKALRVGKLEIKNMKSRLLFVLFATILFASCGTTMTVCDCLKDDGSHKKECDELGNSLSETEMSKEIAKCK
jgi:hypothetical protein